MKNIEIIRLESVDSTNDYLKQLVKDTALNNTVVIANNQTKGKGTKGRSFISLEGGLYMSILVHPKTTDFDATMLTSMTAVAVSETIDQISGEKTKIKWVNDIYLNEKKVCGILCEMGYDSLNKPFVVVGIGVNLFKPKNDFPPEIKDIATYVFSKENKDIKSEFEKVLLKKFFLLSEQLNQKTFLPVYRQKNLVLGKQINVIASSSTRQAVALDIDECCRLLVEYPDKSQEYLSSGEVQIK
ncbi:MAG: biotin--[acetyl-CoA-carboxylase] ligase [Ruminococcaceae bacterium]|nr:biotin--[acetyl-CoA-carboxylase] ligase [Oscillospiraceae bacterium]